MRFLRWLRSILFAVLNGFAKTAMFLILAVVLLVAISLVRGDGQPGNMVLALDSLFVQRARALEKKDGNPLNEVRILCDSIMNNDGAMCVEKTIRIDKVKSVLKYEVGDKIRLYMEDFILLSSCFFAEIEEKYL